MITTDYGNELTRQEAIREELLNGETIEWTGQPDPSIIFSKADIFLVPFSLLWGGFAIFMVWGILSSPSHHNGNDHSSIPTFFAMLTMLIPLAFVLIGQYMIWGRFVYRAWRRKRTVYAVTNKRVIVLTTARRKNVQAVFIREIPTMNKSVGRRGIGTLVFGNADGAWSDYGNTGLGSRYPLPPIFYDIRDAGNVYDLVNRLRNEPEEKRY